MPGAGAPRPDRPLVLDILSKGRYKNEPRKDGRTVPMKLLCLGLSRTGTQSLREALFQLGYEDVYHQTSLNVDNPADSAIWTKALRAKFEGRGKPFSRDEFDQVLGHCMAVTDVPCITFWKELMDAYPDAKVILTVRDDEEVWYRSFMESSMRLLRTLYGNTWIGWIQRRLLFEGASNVYARLLLKYDDAYCACFQDFLHGTQAGVMAYQRYNDAVKEYAARQVREVLEYHVKEGWGPLAAFLDVEAPDTSFPRLNDRRYFQEGAEKIERLVLVGAALQAAALVIPLGVAWYLANRYLP